MNSYLTQAAEQLAQAAAITAGQFSSSAEEAGFRLDIAWGFTRLAAIERGMSPCFCYHEEEPEGADDTGPAEGNQHRGWPLVFA